MNARTVKPHLRLHYTPRADGGDPWWLAWPYKARGAHCGRVAVAEGPPARAMEALRLFMRGGPTEPHIQRRKDLLASGRVKILWE